MLMHGFVPETRRIHVSLTMPGTTFASLNGSKRTDSAAGAFRNSSLMVDLLSSVGGTSVRNSPHRDSLPQQLRQRREALAPVLLAPVRVLLRRQLHVLHGHAALGGAFRLEPEVDRRLVVPGDAHRLRLRRRADFEGEVEPAFAGAGVGEGVEERLDGHVERLALARLPRAGAALAALA